jgi:hypothetical protein
MNAVGFPPCRRIAAINMSRRGSTTSIDRPLSSTPSAYRAQLATTAAHDRTGTDQRNADAVAALARHADHVLRL